MEENEVKQKEKKEVYEKRVKEKGWRRKEVEENEKLKEVEVKGGKKRYMGRRWI